MWTLINVRCHFRIFAPENGPEVDCFLKPAHVKCSSLTKQVLWVDEVSEGLVVVEDGIDP